MSKLVFDSAFATKGLLTSRSGSSTTWATKIAPGNNAQLNAGTEAQYYFDRAGEAENCLAIGNGQVRITAKPVPTKSNPLGMAWGSACLTTAGMAPIPVLGEKEICVKLPAGPGLWPGFWGLPYSQVYAFERDYFENFGCTSGAIQMTQHGEDASNNWQSPHVNAVLADMSDTFVNIMERCTTDTTTLIINGREIAGMPTLPGTLTNGPVFLIANLAVFMPGSWNNSQAAPAPGEHHMVIRSIKAWE